MRTTTVLLPTFRRPRFLREALASIRAQTAVDRIREIVVSENGGDRASAGVAGEFAELPIRYVFRDPPLSSIEHGRTLCQEPGGEFTALLHDDDWWMPDHLANGLRALEENAAAGGFLSSFFNVQGESSLLHCDSNFYFWFGAGYPRFGRVWELGLREAALAALLATPGRYSTLVARTGCFKTVMARVHGTGNPFDNDRMLVVELAKLGPLLFRPFPDVFIRAHAGQDAQTFANEIQRSWMGRTTEWLLEQCAAAGIDLRPVLARRLVDCPAEARYLLNHNLANSLCLAPLRRLAASSPELADLARHLEPHKPGLASRLKPFVPPVLGSVRSLWRRSRHEK